MCIGISVNDFQILPFFSLTILPTVRLIYYTRCAWPKGLIWAVVTYISLELLLHVSRVSQRPELWRSPSPGSVRDRCLVISSGHTPSCLFLPSRDIDISRRRPSSTEILFLWRGDVPMVVLYSGKNSIVVMRGELLS